MFRSPPNAFDEVVSKATDENLTSENWEYILNVCDKVNEKPDEGPKEVVVAIIKRFAHRSANVQLYSLTLADSLSSNCGTKIQRELASRAFTQAVLRLINDRTTHTSVKSRAFELIQQWSEEFKKDPSLSIMEETFRQLKSSNLNIQAPSRPQKHEITDADRKKEEEELQMALALSLSDTHITEPSPPKHQQLSQNNQQSGVNTVAAPNVIAKPQTTAATVSRVKALYDFSPSEPTELPFRRGDVISVLDSVYKDWWRGSLRGQTGIFPVNYVEILKEPTPEELMREAEEEAKIFAEGRNIEKLLTLLANAGEGQGGMDDEGLQSLYNSTLAIRPKLVKLIEKYSMRKDELISLNEKFHKARHDYDSLMESSMSRYSRPAPAPTNPFGQSSSLTSHGYGSGYQIQGSAASGYGYSPQSHGGYPSQQSPLRDDYQRPWTGAQEYSQVTPSQNLTQGHYGGGVDESRPSGQSSDFVQQNQSSVFAGVPGAGYDSQSAGSFSSQTGVAQQPYFAPHQQRPTSGGKADHIDPANKHTEDAYSFAGLGQKQEPIRQDNIPHLLNDPGAGRPSSATAQLSYTSPPAPTSAPPAVPLDQKPAPPYPLAKHERPNFYIPQPGQPGYIAPRGGITDEESAAGSHQHSSMYNPNSGGDRYASLRALTTDTPAGETGMGASSTNAPPRLGGDEGGHYTTGGSVGREDLKDKGQGSGGYYSGFGGLP